MPASDILARLGGLLMVMSSLWNGFLSLVWILAMVWVCIGVIWLIPLVMAVGVFCIGVASMALGYQKWTIAGPLMSMVVSICNFNVLGFFLDIVTLGLMGGSMMMRQQEEAELM